MQPRRSRRLATKMQEEVSSGDDNPSIIFPSLAAAISPKARAASRKVTTESTKGAVTKRQRAKDKEQPWNHAATSESRTIADPKGDGNDSTDPKTSANHRTTTSMSIVPPQSRRGAQPSKLPGSSRTGKNLSAIPSESPAPPSPLVEFSSSDLNEEIEREDESVREKPNTH